MNKHLHKTSDTRYQPSVMRRTGFILISILFLHFCFAFSYGQAIRIKEQGTTLQSIFNKIKKQNGYHFFWEGQDLSNIQVDVDTQGNITEVLDEVFSSLPLQYRLHKKTVIISQDPRKAALLQQNASQEQAINGRVIDENGYPIAGVSVVVKGDKKGVATDINGRFHIHSTRRDAQLLISCLGYETREIKGQEDLSDLIIILNRTESTIEEIAIYNSGYQKFNRPESTGAMELMNSKEIEKRNNNSLERLLEGSIPGLSVYTDPAGNNDIRVRGGSSLRAGTQPLFVVDGFPSEIMPNVNEIESITVLKDAAAAAIWGSQASNGVVVITTKQGKEGKLQIDYSGNTRIQFLPDYNALQRADAATVIDYEKEQFDKDYIMSLIFDNSSTGYSQSIGIFNDYDRGDITLEERDRRLDQLAGLSNTSQIEDYLLRNSVNQSHYLAFSGGNDKHRFFTTGDFQSDLSGIRENNAKRMSLNSRNSHSVSSFLTLRTNLAVQYRWGRSGLSNMEDEIRKLQPYQLLFDEHNLPINSYYDYNKVENDRLVSEGYLDNGLNLWTENNLANNKNDRWGLKTHIGTDWNIWQGLSLSNDFVYERNSGNNRNLFDQESYMARSLINRLTERNADGSLEHHIPKGDILDISHIGYKHTSLRNQFNYNNRFDEKHFVNAIAGFDISKTVNESQLTRKLGYNDDLLSSQSIDAKQLASEGILDWEGRRQRYYENSYNNFRFIDNREYSYYTSVTYSYDKRYTLSGSYRTDHSNLFGADPKFRRTPLWSIGGNYTISNEPFFQSSFINTLGIRGTVGLTGNFDRGNQSTTFMVARRFFNTVINDYVARIDSPPNPKLRWERSKTINLGIDMDMFSNRIHLTADYYHKNSYDLLGSLELDPTVGLTQASINAASMTNKGVEMQLRADILQRSPFKWSSTINLGHNTSKVTSNKIRDTNPAINRPRNVVPFLEGYARESLWSYRWAGLDHEGRPMTYDAEGNTIYSAVEASLEYSGTTQPRLYGGWMNDFSYKGFNLMIYTVFNQGHVGRREMPGLYGFEWNGSYNKQIADRWRQPGDELLTDIPALPEMQYLSDEYTRLATLSSTSVFNASFLRIREIQLAYTFDREFLGSRSPFRSARLVAQLNNVYLWKANKHGIDPEAVANGRFYLPEPSVMTFGINFGL